VRRELEDLCLPDVKKPREFLNLVESSKNRFVRWLGDRCLARILGQKNGLDLRAVLDNREATPSAEVYQRLYIGPRPWQRSSMVYKSAVYPGIFGLAPGMAYLYEASMAANVSLRRICRLTRLRIS
jgi:hypothetical protein